MMQHLFILVCGWLIPLAACLGQTFAITEVLPTGDSVYVRYYIDDAPEHRYYHVALNALVQNDTLPLKSLKGAIGDSIQAGSHEMVWLARQEWGRFRGSVTLLLEATPAFEFRKPAGDTALRPGEKLVVSWYGGNANQTDLQLFLYKGNQLVDTIGTAKQQIRYEWLIPKSTAPGKTYRVFAQEPDGNIEAFSPTFRIRSKLKWWYIAVPVAAAAGTAAFLLMPQDEPSPLPPPPGSGPD